MTKSRQRINALSAQSGVFWGNSEFSLGGDFLVGWELDICGSILSGCSVQCECAMHNTLTCVLAFVDAKLFKMLSV